MAMRIFLAMRIDAYVGYIRHMSDITRYCRIMWKFMRIVDIRIRVAIPSRISFHLQVDVQVCWQVGQLIKKKTVLICCFPGPVMALLPPQTNVIYKLSFSGTKQLIRPKPTSTLIYKGPLLYTDKRTHLQTTNSNTKRLVKLYKNAKEFRTDVKSNSLQSRRNIINQTAPLCSHSDNCCRIRDGLDRIN